MIELKGFRALQQLASLDEGGSSSKYDVKDVPVNELSSGRFQPRTTFAKEELFELAESIKQQGIIQPLIVRKIASNKYEIIAGERRWRAAKMSELAKVPVIIRDVKDSVALAFALIENIQRQDLNVIEEAKAYHRFQIEFKMTHEEIAKYVGKSRASITNILRLLKLEKNVISYIESGKLDMGHARCLVSLDQKSQLEFAKKINEKKLSVRETEKMISNKLGGWSTPHKKKKISSCSESMLDKLKTSFGSKVELKPTMGEKGKLVICYDTELELKKLVDILC